METQSSARIINFHRQIYRIYFLKTRKFDCLRHSALLWNLLVLRWCRQAEGGGDSGSERCVTGARHCSGCILNTTYIDLTFYLPNFADSLSKKKFA